MAKKRGEGGSNLGLIITLVFFVLSTVILGVTTYIGYSGQEQLVQAKDKAEKEAKVAEADKQWYRHVYRVARSYVDQTPPGVDAAELQAERQKFAILGQNQKDKDDIEKWVNGMNARMPWPPTNNAPTATYERRIGELNQLIGNLRNDLDKERKALAQAKKDLDDEKDQHAKQLADNKKTYEDQIAQERAARQKDKKESDDKLQVLIDRSKNVDNTLQKQLQDTKDEMAKAQKDLDKVKGERARLNEERNNFKRLLDETNRKMDAVVQKTGVDLREIEAKELVATAKDKLQRWDKSWQVVAIDRRGQMPYINLGSADKVTPQLTFSIHDRKLDGRLNPTPKATCEVVRVLEPHLSQVKITSAGDARRDPVLKGDRLFHPTWDPDRKKHIAIAGVIDLDGDGTDGTAKFLRLLAKQNIEVDAYIDVSDEKAPKLWEREKDRPVSIDTEYLILGSNVSNTKHPKAKEATYNQQFDALMKKLKDAATDRAVKPIRLGEYLEMMGYSGGRSRGDVGRSYGR